MDLEIQFLDGKQTSSRELTLLAFTFPKTTTETLEKGVKCSKLSIKTKTTSLTLTTSLSAPIFYPKKATGVQFKK